MEGFSAENYQQHYSTDQSSSATEISNPPPPPPEVMLAEYNPKKRAGRKKFKETRHPVYRGIRQRNVDKWVCETREPNKKTRIWLGTYPTAEMAARAYDVAAIALRGRSACLNFADSAWRLPVPASSDTKHIQQAAAEAAELFRPGYQAAADASSSAVGEEGDHMGWMDDYLSGMPDLFGETSNDGLPPAPPAPEYADMAQYDVGAQNEDHHHRAKEVGSASGPAAGVGEMRNMSWMDEDAFGMPENIVADMYNGMMLPPPPPPPPAPPDYADMGEDDDFTNLPLWDF